MPLDTNIIATVFPYLLVYNGSWWFSGDGI